MPADRRLSEPGQPPEERQGATGGHESPACRGTAEPQNAAGGRGDRGRPGPAERVFSDRTGRAIQEDGFRNNVWVPLLRRAQLRYRKPHTLRHSFASMLIEAGEPLTYVQQQLGHHSAAFTLKVYGHLLPRGDRRAVDGLDDTTIRNLAATRSSPASRSRVFLRTSASHSSISENRYSDGSGWNSGTTAGDSSPLPSWLDEGRPVVCCCDGEEITRPAFRHTKHQRVSAQARNMPLGATWRGL
jgi:hypothetical protein